MEFHVLIPARFESTRLPGKLLMKVKGKTLLEHACRRAHDSGAENVIVATDNEDIARVCERIGVEVCVTLPTYSTGIERLSEVVDAMEYEDDQIVVYMSADLVALPSLAIRKVAEALEDHSHVKVTSLCCPIQDFKQLHDPNVVKVVLNRRNQAVYFSRSPIPWGNKEELIEADGDDVCFRHIGLYACRAKFFQDYMNWPVCPLERLEQLEQLRIVWNGGRIQVVVWDKFLEGGVYSEDDLDKLGKKLK